MIMDAALGLQRLMARTQTAPVQQAHLVLHAKAG
jgi:hypothetical protein